MFRMLLIGIFENLTRERANASCCEDTHLSIAIFGYNVSEDTQDHYSMSRFGTRLLLTAFDSVFDLVIPGSHLLGWFHSRIHDVDTVAINANADLLYLRRITTSEQYRAYVQRLAEVAGVDSADPAAVSRLDRNRPNHKTSKKSWKQSHDPNAEVFSLIFAACV